MTRLGVDRATILVGAGPVDRDTFDHARRFADRIVAVDGGFDTLSSWGIVPEAVLGDMDSIASEVPGTVECIPIAEQDSTDLEKALRTVDAPLRLGVGFLGGRIDHTLAAMHALVAAGDSRTILIGVEDVVFAAPPEWRAALEPGTRVSFYPVRRVAALGSKGLRWPIDGLVLEAGHRIGVSNRTVSSSVAAWFAERGAVTILPRASLGAAIASLA